MRENKLVVAVLFGLVFGLGTGFLLGVGLMSVLPSFEREDRTSARVGNLWISSASGWVAKQHNDTVLVSETRGVGHITFGPTLPEEEALVVHAEVLPGASLIVEELPGDILVSYNVSASPSPGLLKIEGFVTRGEYWTHFVGEYSPSKVAAARVFEMLRSIREVI